MGVVGIIPLVDLVLQNFVIKKDAAKTVGEIFGIDVKFIDEENAKNEKKTKEVNLNYINKIVEDRILDDSTEYKVQETAPVQKAASSSQSAAAASSSNILCRLASIGLLGFEIILDVGLGAYLTHKFCEELLDKFVDYYKNNADKLSNSYKKAADYFLMNEN